MHIKIDSYSRQIKSTSQERWRITDKEATKELDLPHSQGAMSFYQFGFTF